MLTGEGDTGNRTDESLLNAEKAHMMLLQIDALCNSLLER